MPFFSIVLPTYNRAHMLPMAIDSVLSQTFTDWELLIVDDGSTDDTKKTVEDYADQRIKYFYQKNQERSAARNNGIEQANGEYICFLDSDDYYLPEKLEKLYEHIVRFSEKEALFYDGVQIETNGKRTISTLPDITEFSSFSDFLILNSLFSQQVCIPKEIVQKNKYNPDIRIGEDVELWLRIASHYKFIHVSDSNNTVIVEHDDRSVNLRKYNSAVEQLKLYRYVFNEGHPGNVISSTLKKKMISESMFNIAKYYMYNNFKFKALRWTLRASLRSTENSRLKHFMYCISSLLKGKIPEEYQSL
jgi:glycosyltransferase involved in cell wall biosynthesis